jgi:phage gpG-like protein
MNLILDIEKAEKRLKNIEKNFKNSKKVLEVLGQEINKDIKLLFESKTSPFGVRWIPSKSNPDTLVDTGDLRDSGKVIATNNKVIISYGNGLNYGRIHNDGIGKMPKRQFVPNEGKLPADWKKRINKKLTKGFLGKINE